MDSIAPAPHMDAPTRRRAILLLAMAIFTLSVGMNVHMAMNVNFIDQALSASPWEQGYLESIRESCGIVSFITIVLLVGFSEPRIAAVMVVLVGFGLSSYYAIGSIHQLILLSLIWSFGLHVWMPISRSMQIALAQAGREGSTQGSFHSVGAAGVLCALGFVYLLKKYAGLDMRQLFLLAGAVTAIGAIPLLLMPAIRAQKSDKMPFRRIFQKGYRLYCGLELLDGMRKQIFILFAVLTLVREQGIRVETIAALMFINQIVCLVLAPVAGHAVDRFGERPLLSLYFAAVGVLFLMYAAVSSTWALYTVFVIDNALFVFKVGLPTYAGRVAAKGERTSLLAMGVTMNHIGAVILPLLGGAMYAAWGYRIPFICGAAIAALSLVVVQAMDSTKADVDGATRRARMRMTALICLMIGSLFAGLYVRGVFPEPSTVHPLDHVPAQHRAGSLERHGRQTMMHLSGTPRELGEQHGTLCREGISLVLDRYVMGQLLRTDDSRDARYIAYTTLAGKLRESLPPSYLEELDACAAAAGVDKHLLLLAQCEGDIQAVAAGGRAGAGHACSAYIAFGAATVDGHLECGRNLDYTVGEGLQEHCSLVTYWHPESGHSFAAVGMTGIIGGATLVNDAGLVVANHLRGGGSATDEGGLPALVLMRVIAEKASTIAEAVKIIESARRMRSQIIWLAQPADEQLSRPASALAVYYDAETVQVREAIDGALVVTNTDIANYDHCSVHSALMEMIGERRGILDGSIPLTASPKIARPNTLHIVQIDFSKGTFSVWHGATPAQLGEPEVYRLPGK